MSKWLLFFCSSNNNEFWDMCQYFFLAPVKLIPIPFMYQFMHQSLAGWLSFHLLFPGNAHPFHYQMIISKNGSGLLRLFSGYEQHGDREQARRHYQEAVGADPQNAF
ncbi:MAG: hypothetical protein JXA18_13990 [Chitinispirillaceae bacterium]|nr:hypothetical protein [Chitinispirillaceae bacterium]